MSIPASLFEVMPTGRLADMTETGLGIVSRHRYVIWECAVCEEWMMQDSVDARPLIYMISLTYDKLELNLPGFGLRIAVIRFSAAGEIGLSVGNSYRFSLIRL